MLIHCEILNYLSLRVHGLGLKQVIVSSLCLINLIITNNFSIWNEIQCEVRKNVSYIEDLNIFLTLYFRSIDETLSFAHRRLL